MVELHPTLGQELLPSPAVVSPIATPRLRLKRPTLAIPLRRADLPALSLLVLASTLVGGWVAFNNLLFPTLAAGHAVDPRTPLLFVLLQEKTITFVLAVAVALLLVAAAFAVAPWRWWAFCYGLSKMGLRAQFKQVRGAAAEPEDAEAWVAAQQAWIDAQQADGAIQEPDVHAAGSTAVAAVPGEASPAADADPAPATPAAGEPAASTPTTAGAATAGAPATEGGGADSTPAPGTPGAPAPQPADPQAQPQAADQAAQPAAAKAPKGVPAPPPQTTSELAKLTEQNDEALDLEALTDVQDILSSFTDNDTISSELLALSASVGEVPVTALIKHMRQVNQHLHTGRRIQPDEHADMVVSG